VPRDAISLVTNEAGVLAIADHLWDRTASPALADRHDAPIELRIEVAPDSAVTPGREPPQEHWTVTGDTAELSLNDQLQARIDCLDGKMQGRVSEQFVASEPSLVARLLLETPVAALLARRGYAVVHGGGVSGEGGAVVLRGPSGAGKSTLVAAAHRAGLGVLGDETVLVARDNHDDLLAAVRDPMLQEDSWYSLGLGERSVDGTHPRSGKRRLDLFASSTPVSRRARRVATVILGPREGSYAHLESLTSEQFLAMFRGGEIPQERWGGVADRIAVAWSRAGAYRLTGARDLVGAVELLRELVVKPTTASHS
jgi:hypothetical protein